MTRQHFRLSEPHWQRNSLINGLGAVATFVVLLVVLISRFTIGAWIPAVLIPILVVLFKVFAEHYHRAEVDLASPAGSPPAENIVVLLDGSGGSRCVGRREPRSAPGHPALPVPRFERAGVPLHRSDRKVSSERDGTVVMVPLLGDRARRLHQPQSAHTAASQRVAP